MFMSARKTKNPAADHSPELPLTLSIMNTVHGLGVVDTGDDTESERDP